MSHHLRVDRNGVRLGIVGDLHTHWDQVDVHQLAGCDYDLLYFVGDLGGGLPDSTLRIARSIAQLSCPTLVMPGNNDTVDINELAAELALQQGARQLLALGRDDTGPPDIRLCGYSHHLIEAVDFAVSLIAARPHSMGGPTLSFPDYMADTYGIDSLEQSTERLCALVDEAEAEHLVFLAHNGPLGFGEAPDAMWGNDFKPGGGDWGDVDLSRAIDHARARGKSVLAVVAGHMHLRTKQGAERPWLADVDGTVYINAARVPRIFSGKDDVYRHHVSMTLGPGGVAVEEVLLPEYGDG
ncbi:hypothetical protein FV139_04590 [Parahaliea maris]|uniref:Calcineurin-like phosphoesterase domain-containing protein n=1 Tax=Parahaliea maris TaxID=2716870 RepID=A0A5C9A5C7_9GAMM|nr:metallophosphoesterase family protein [Parahaliea maris]TXS95182.1 hypothetical protein FV139_04590 [Parahaliea maris]